MEHRHDRDDVVGQQFVDQPVIEGDTRRILGPVAVRDDARPRDREAVGLQPHLRHQGDVFDVAVVMVGCDAIVGGPLGVVGAGVLNRWSLPVLVPGQVVSKKILYFLAQLDVKEIHGYNPDLGLSVFTQEALARFC